MQLGSLVVGIPSATFSSISGMILLAASKNPSVVSHLVTAPQIVRQTFVSQVGQFHTFIVNKRGFKLYNANHR